jgi:hypothetical protein
MHDVIVDSINSYFWDYFVFVQCSFCYNSLNFETTTIKLQKTIKSKEIREKRSQ